MTAKKAKQAPVSPEPAKAPSKEDAGQAELQAQRDRHEAAGVIRPGEEKT